MFSGVLIIIQQNNSILRFLFISQRKIFLHIHKNPDIAQNSSLHFCSTSLFQIPQRIVSQQQSSINKILFEFMRRKKYFQGLFTGSFRILVSKQLYRIRVFILHAFGLKFASLIGQPRDKIVDFHGISCNLSKQNISKFIG